MKIFGFLMFITGLIALAFMWPPILIIYMIFGGIMIMAAND